jgi:tetratricopeptide (TPR) repeat protein
LNSQLGILGTNRKEGIMVMNRDLFNKLVSKASEMALANKWGEKTYKINTMILEMDSSNSAACTRLAKYFKLNDNLMEAKKMYSKALEINPNNQGAMNNLIEIETYQQDRDFIDKLTTSREAYDSARSLAQKGKYGLSIECFIKAYSMEPLLKYAFTLARVYKKLGKHDEVKKVYNQLVTSNSSQNNIDTINAEFVVLMQR